MLYAGCPALTRTKAIKKDKELWFTHGVVVMVVVLTKMIVIVIAARIMKRINTHKLDSIQVAEAIASFSTQLPKTWRLLLKLEKKKKNCIIPLAVVRKYPMGGGWSKGCLGLPTPSLSVTSTINSKHSTEILQNDKTFPSSVVKYSWQNSLPWVENKYLPMYSTTRWKKNYSTKFVLYISFTFTSSRDCIEGKLHVLNLYWKRMWKEKLRFLSGISWCLHTHTQKKAAYFSN